MKFSNFKDFLEYKEEELDKLAEELADEGMHELSRNILFSDRTWLYEADAQDAIKNELKEIFAVFLPCVQFLGPNRMKKIVEAINKNLTKASTLKQTTYDYSKTKHDADSYDSKSDAEKAIIDQNIKNIQIRTYKLCIRLAKMTDKYGLEKVQLKLQGNKISLINEASGDNEASFKNSMKTLWGWTKNALKWAKNAVSAIFNKFKKFLSTPQNGKPADINSIVDMYDARWTEVDESSSDEDKKKYGITWAKKVTDADIKIMNLKDSSAVDDANDTNNDVDTKMVKSNDAGKYRHSFFKSIVLLSLKFGPKSLEVLADATRKAINDAK